jgi:para-aminobenzoate synthetase component I
VKPIIEEVAWNEAPEWFVPRLAGERGIGLLRSGMLGEGQGRYSLLVANPFYQFRSTRSRIELTGNGETHVLFGNPWEVLDRLMARYELLDEIDLPFPLGGCFGCWGYDLKNFVEPTVPRNALNDLELPDCQLGFYDSVVVFDHQLMKVWIVATGMLPDGSRSRKQAERSADFWHGVLAVAELPDQGSPSGRILSPSKMTGQDPAAGVVSNFTREGFVDAVKRAKAYIRQGDIYQVNLAQRLCVPSAGDGWELFERLHAVSPAPYSAYFDFGDWQLVSSSPELFLRLNGSEMRTRPIKGTRPRSADPVKDAQFTYELQTSPKEMAELVMITDLLRNDLGRVCEFGSVNVPDLVRLEKYPQVQHLVSTVDGRLRPELTHTDALARCFPGGSITGAPKVRAMQIIEELEPVTRGPYTGCHGYLGFNRESMLSISIRTAVVQRELTSFHAGAGIVADSDPEMEYEETLAKARGFLRALELPLDGIEAGVRKRVASGGL